jgi:hypothetical protein
MTTIPVRTASRLWFRVDATLRSASLTCRRWRLLLTPILPF